MAIDWFWIVGWLFTFFGLVGNIWVIFIIAKRRRLRTTTNWFVLSFAAADLCVIGGYFPASMICEVLRDKCNYDVRMTFTFFFRDISSMGLIAIVAEHYIAIVHSLRYFHVFTTTKRTFMIVALC